MFKKAKYCIICPLPFHIIFIFPTPPSLSKYSACPPNPFKLETKAFTLKLYSNEPFFDLAVRPIGRMGHATLWPRLVEMNCEWLHVWLFHSAGVSCYWVTDDWQVLCVPIRQERGGHSSKIPTLAKGGEKALILIYPLPRDKAMGLHLQKKKPTIKHKGTPRKSYRWWVCSLWTLKASSSREAKCRRCKSDFLLMESSSQFWIDFKLAMLGILTWNKLHWTNGTLPGSRIWLHYSN